ncbi:MAG: hypothetical protein K8Q97_00910 [Candidatus Andersenbacteria bacterium]|nr:hypothetical protein [Candidatus Andersenbacteria bacterium]
MPVKQESVFNHVFSEIFEEPMVDLSRIRPCEQLLFLTMSLGRVIEQLESEERDIFGYRLGLADDGVHSASEVATLLGIGVQAVDAHYAEGLRKVRAHPDVQSMRAFVRRAVVT